MRKVIVLACSLAFVAAAGFAQAPAHPENPYWAAIFAPGEAGAPGAAVREVSTKPKRPGGKVICAAAANCWNGTTVNCSSSTPGDTCAGTDSSCTAQQGFVRCGSSYTYCPACGSGCIEGQTRFVPTGFCCDDDTREKEIQTCSGGVWFTTDYQCGPMLCRPIQQQQ
jgi:hypothetical protein